MKPRNHFILAAAVTCICMVNPSCDALEEYIGDNNSDDKTASEWTELGGANTFPGEGEVYSIVADNEGNVYAAGELYVARWEKATNKWEVIGSMLNLDANTDVRYPLAIDQEGNLYARKLEQLPQQNATHHIAKWDKIPYQWSELGTGLSFNNSLRQIATDYEGNVYASGENLNFSSRYYVERWKKSDGTWEILGNPPQGDVNCIIADPEGNIYIGGQFVNDNYSVYVSKWDGSGWSELGGANSCHFRTGFINSILMDKLGNVYAGGLYTNGSDCDNLAVWDKDSNSWSFEGRMYTDANYDINSLVFDTDGNLYAGGIFTINGKTCVGKWDGKSWTNLGNMDLNGPVRALCIDNSGNLYAGGSFTSESGKIYVAVHKK